MFHRTVDADLEIRQFALSDAPLVYELVDRNRPYLREWLPWVDGTASVEPVAEFITRAAAQWDAGLGTQCGIFAGGELIGSIGVHPIDWANRNCSIGYWVDASQQRKGIVTRCCTSLLDYLFEELSLHRVEIRCGTGNHKSCAIPQRLGFTRDGVAREAEWVSGRWVDLVVWSMLEEEWRKHRADHQAGGSTAPA
jgi:ribosomal-protein-serine acetyltransferase